MNFMIMDTPAGHMNHLLAGLAAYSLVDRVCSSSMNSMWNDSEGPAVEWDSFKKLWLANLKTSSEFPNMLARKRAGMHDTAGVGTDHVPPPPLVDFETAPKSSRPSSCAHWRLSETCSQHHRGQDGCPLPRMHLPLLFSCANEGGGGRVPHISYQYMPNIVRCPPLQSHIANTLMINCFSSLSPRLSAPNHYNKPNQLSAAARQALAWR